MFFDTFSGSAKSKLDNENWEYQTPLKNDNDEIQHYKSSSENAYLSGKGSAIIAPRNLSSF